MKVIGAILASAVALLLSSSPSVHAVAVDADTHSSSQDMILSHHGASSKKCCACEKTNYDKYRRFQTTGGEWVRSQQIERSSCYVEATRRRTFAGLFARSGSSHCDDACRSAGASSRHIFMTIDGKRKLKSKVTSSCAQAKIDQGTTGWLASDCHSVTGGPRSGADATRALGDMIDRND